MMLKKLKNTYFVISAILFLVFISGCDYPEKSINALSDRDIPKAATQDFVLPRGVYAPIAYTSSNPEILEVYDGHYVRLHPQVEDVAVTLEARVNKRYKAFEIIVLKAGSPLTPRERIIKLWDTFDFPTQINDKYVLPTEVDGLKLNYDYLYAFTKEDYQIKSINEELVLIPNLTKNRETSIRIRVDLSAFTDFERSDVYMMSKSYGFKINNVNPNTVNYQINQEIKFQFAEGDSFNSVTKPFKLPQYTGGYDCNLNWSLDTYHFGYLKDGEFKIVDDLESGHYEVTLYLDVTYQEMTQRFSYRLTIIK